MAKETLPKKKAAPKKKGAPKKAKPATKKTEALKVNIDTKKAGAPETIVKEDKPLFDENSIIDANGRVDAKDLIAQTNAQAAVQEPTAIAETDEVETLPDVAEYTESNLEGFIHEQAELAGQVKIEELVLSHTPFDPKMLARVTDMVTDHLLEGSTLSSIVRAQPDSPRDCDHSKMMIKGLYQRAFPIICAIMIGHGNNWIVIPDPAE